MYCMYVMWYTQIHTNTYIYMHIHTYTCNDLGQVYYAECYLPRSAQTGLRTGSSSAHCAWRAHELHRGAAFAPPDACSAHKCAKMGPGVGPWSRDKVAGLLPMAVRSGARWLPAPPGDVSGLLWALTHKAVYVACMWPTYVYMYTHVYTCMPIHTSTYGLISELTNVLTCIHMCADTCNTCNMDWFQYFTCSTHVAHIHTYTCKYST
jgi:hypothetical protein